MRAPRPRGCAIALGFLLALAGCSDTFQPADSGPEEPLPEGTLIFGSTPGFDFAQLRIERMHVDGSERAPISEFVGYVYRPELSPDGTSLLFSTETDPAALSSPFHLVRMRLDTGAVEDVPSSDDSWSGSWSPDGSRIAFASGRTRHGDIFVMSSDGSNVQALTDDADYKGELHWDPRGETIVYVNRHGGGPDRTADLWVVPASGGAPAPLLELEDPLGRSFPTWCRFPRWSPDGSRIVFEGQTSTYGDAGGGIYVARADGSGIVQVVPASGNYPSWSPDGEWIVLSRSVHYEDPRESSHELFLVRPDGTGLRQLTATRDVDEVFPIWVE